MVCDAGFGGESTSDFASRKLSVDSSRLTGTSPHGGGERRGSFSRIGQPAKIDVLMFSLEERDTAQYQESVFYT